MKRITQNDLRKMYEAPPQELTEQIHETISSLPVRGQEEKIVKKKLSFSVIAAIALVIVLMATALAGAVNEDFNTMLYETWPEFARLLMPVNLTYEDQGIRMEVLSAVAYDKAMLITFSLQDLEGSRIDAYTDASIEIDYDNFEDCDGYCASLSPGYYDEAEKKARFINEIEFDSAITPQDGQIIAHLDTITPHQYSTLDLLPLLNEYGSQARPMPVPDNAYAYGGYENGEWSIQSGDNYVSPWTIPDSMRVLDNHNMPEVQLADCVYLSGIGMVDGLLHVQLHYTELEDTVVTGGTEYDSHTVYYYPWDVWITLRDPDDGDAPGPSPKYRQESLLNGGFTHLWWEENGEGWEEDIFTVDDKLTEDQIFMAETTVTLPPIFGRWDVSLPLRLIKKGSQPDLPAEN